MLNVFVFVTLLVERNETFWGRSLSYARDTLMTGKISPVKRLSPPFSTSPAFQTPPAPQTQMEEHNVEIHEMTNDDNELCF